MDGAKLAALLSAFVTLGIRAAETIHPLSDSAHQKLATATTIVQTGLGIAIAAGAIPGAAATAVDIVAKVNEAVAKANAAGGVPKLAE